MDSARPSRPSSVEREPIRRTIDTRDPVAVAEETERLFQRMFPHSDMELVPRAFSWITECFSGRYKNYLPIDAGYHDFEHTLLGSLCLARLLRGRHFADARPAFTQHMCELGLLAVLAHDTGYLKQRNDPDGTGAKYTATHVRRSKAFAGVLLREKGFTEDEIRAVQNMINCTKVNANIATMPFSNEQERLMGGAVATADLLGQMADPRYVEKLPALYREFAEAANYDRQSPGFFRGFNSADELIRNTPDFWKNYAVPKLENDCRNLFRYLNDPYPSGPNPYVIQIESNLQQVRSIIDAMKT